MAVPSPDGKYEILVDAIHLTVRELRSGKVLNPAVGIYSLAEVAWAPDSRAFFINESDGVGDIGIWNVRAYALSEDALRALAPVRLAGPRFAKRYCPEGFPNLVAAGWDGGSERLLLVGEVPNSDIYRNRAFIHGYLVNGNDGTILAEFSKKQLNHKWNQLLGPRLGGSDARWKEQQGEKKP